MLLSCKTTVIVTLTFAELSKKFSEFYRSQPFIAIIDVTDILDNSYSWRRPNAKRPGEWISLRLQAVELDLFR
jgi:N-acetyl-gamma-glutamylphosphate reductase